MLEVLNPATEEVVERLEPATEEDADAAVARAKKAFPAWRDVEPSDRSRLLRRLADALGHEEHRHTPGTFADHEVRLVPGSLAARAAASEVTPVKSHHHQGIKEVGSGLEVTGWGAEDDAVEALEDPSCPFVLGVLWHPEEDEKSRIIKALVSEVS